MPRPKSVQKHKKLSGETTQITSTNISTDEPPQKVIKFSGKVPVDEGFPKYANGLYHVYIEQGNVYNAMLNQTNIGQNNNKYYIIQVLKHNVKNEYVNVCRWGRVGKVAGSSENVTADVMTAKTDFASKFYSKTGNTWSSFLNSTFHKRAGKYDVVEIDHGADTVKEEVSKSNILIASTLQEPVQDLIKLIFNKDEWEASVKEMKFDVKKAPLGKLTKEQIKAGYKSLKKIEDCVKSKKNKEEIEKACSEFYTRIPHDFGMKKPPLIETNEAIKEKTELLEALNDIQVAVTLMDEKKNETDKNTLDHYYDSLHCDIKPLKKSDQEYKIIAKYIKNTHGSLHRHFSISIEEIFEVNKDAVSQKFKKNLGNRMLLWHGSRLTNWCGILKQGLRIAPPEAPVTGYMFGKGVYFADMVSKSAQYCHTSVRQPFGFLLLCEVALGGMNEKTNADFNANQLPKGKNSTKGLGRQEPNCKEWHKMENGAVVPFGKPKDTNRNGVWLRYNEYIVYDVSQINPRYLVKIKCKYNY